jgi:RimJ/RimL family protein N-acetyltransferase
MSERTFGFPVEGWQPPSRPLKASLRGNFAILEPLNAEKHCSDLFLTNRKSDLIWDYLPYGPFTTEASYRTWVVASQDRSDPFFFAVIDRESGKALGVMSFLRVAPEAGSIEVGHINWSLPMQKSKIATEALFLMMKWSFEAGYRRFEWKCDALNMGSRRAAQRFGFSYEGIFRQALVTNGRNRDTAWFACIDSEWPKLKAAYDHWLHPDNFTSDGTQILALSALTRDILYMEDPCQTDQD